MPPNLKQALAGKMATGFSFIRSYPLFNICREDLSCLRNHVGLLLFSSPVVVTETLFQDVVVHHSFVINAEQKSVEGLIVRNS